MTQYGATIFAGVGISDSYVTQIILGAVNVVTTFPGLWFLERFGRRKTLFWGALWQSAWLFGFAIAGKYLSLSPCRLSGVLSFIPVVVLIRALSLASVTPTRPFFARRNRQRPR